MNKKPSILQLDGFFVDINHNFELFIQPIVKRVELKNKIKEDLIFLLYLLMLLLQIE